METKKIIGLILQIPMYALILGSFITSLYAAWTKIQGITWITPIIFAVIIIAFMIGKNLWKSEEQKQNIPQQ